MLPFVDALPLPWRAVAYILAFLAGLLLLERGADWFTDAIADIAKRLHAPQTLVGLLTAGAEWEELVVVLTAVIGGHSGIAIGDILGSTIANVLGSFPLGLFGRKPLVVERTARFYALAMLAITLLVSGLLVAGPITRPIGGALIGIFAIYAASILLLIRAGRVRQEDVLPAEDDDDDDDDDEHEASERHSLPVHLLFLVIGVVAISLGAYLVVEPAVYFAHALGVSETIVGLTIVAIGTTLPDKAISLAGGLKRQSGIVVANAIGSNIFVLTLVLGLSALASPVIANTQAVGIDILVMIGSTVLLFVLLLRTRLHWRIGLVLLLLYLLYVLYQYFGK
ncbi:MAG: hypothetical protein OJF49_001745 [Ktedonobacterales bacterium]|jgi:K+-dependent Na+/Ca+ exchanger-like protein|nr:MAG: hypothetical protein OJF49_001745 [Ktedonobacterales bacterium]